MTNVTKPGKAKNGYVLPDEKFKQREAAFAVYRDMGVKRTIAKLRLKLLEEQPELAASRTVMEKWSKLHGWAARAKAHDDALVKGQSQRVAMAQAATPPARKKLNVDPIEALLTAASNALERAMNATPVVTRPGDVKSLVDAAANALKLVETIKNQSTGKVSREEVAQDMGRIMALVRQARQHDIELAVDAELVRRGHDPVYDTSAIAKPAAAPPKPVKAGGAEAVDIEIGADDDVEQPRADGVEPIAAQPTQSGKVNGRTIGLPRFADVLKTFRGS